LVNDFWGVRKGTLTPRSNNWGIDTLKLSEKVDGFVCRPCIKEDGMPYGMDLWVGTFQFVGIACEIGAVVEAAVCAGEDTWARIVDPVNVIARLVLLVGIDCVPTRGTSGFVIVSDALAALIEVPI